MADGGGERTIERLKAGAGTYACGGYLAGLGALQRTELLTALLFDRLGRKIRRVGALLSETSDNWNETFYRLYFRTLGDSRNQEAYLSLARRVPYRTVLRERLAPQAVEAMLFGASGLLALYRHDAYTLDLGRHFEYLSAKYGIEAMDASEWTLADIRPANHPALRIAQAARFFAQDEFVMARAMACRTEEDIRRLFCIEASPYWRTHYVPGDSALSLLERLPSEDNRFMRAWSGEGVPIRNAFESQALLQLATEYCARTRCAECPVGRRIAAHTDNSK